MTTLTEREYNMLKLALSHGTAVPLEHAAKKMKYVKKVEKEPTLEMRRNHAKLALRMLSLKLAAMGITFGRVTALGRGYKGLYDFDTVADRKAALKIAESWAKAEA